MDINNANNKNDYFREDCVCFSANKYGMNVCSGYVIPDCAECNGYRSRGQWIEDQVRSIKRLILIGYPLSTEYRRFLSKYSEYSKEIAILDSEVNRR